MGIIINNSQMTKDATPSQIAIDQDVLHALTLSWKGLTTDGAELVIKEFQNLESDTNHVLTYVISLLLASFTGFLQTEIT